MSELATELYSYDCIEYCFLKKALPFKKINSIFECLIFKAKFFLYFLQSFISLCFIVFLLE